MTAQIISNRISFKIPGDDMQAIQGAIKVLQDTLLPHLVDLGQQDRRAMPIMGAKTVDFVSKSLTHATNHPTVIPGFVDLDEFANDLAAVGMLRSLLNPLQQITDVVSDSLALSGSEAYAAALVCYKSFKSASKMGVPGTTTIAEDLAERFPGRASGGKRRPVPVGGPTPQPGVPS